jgi:hypothetical protein
LVQGVIFCVLGLVVGLLAGWIDRNGGWAAATAATKRGGAWLRDQMPKKAAPTPVPVVVAATDGASPALVEAVSPGASATGEHAGALAGVVASGVLAPRLPEPKRRVRSAHWWRAAALLIVGLFAVFSPGSLTNIVVILIGLALLYLAVTEALAAWASPKEPRAVSDEATARESGPSDDEPPEAA